MADRCGSYPLMNLAADYGVDYGDVLTISLEFRYAQLPPGRALSISAAATRIGVAIGYDRLAELSMKVRTVVWPLRAWWP